MALVILFQSLIVQWIHGVFWILVDFVDVSNGTFHLLLVLPSFGRRHFFSCRHTFGEKVFSQSTENIFPVSAQKTFLIPFLSCYQSHR